MTLLEAIGNILGCVLGLIICLVLHHYYKGDRKMTKDELEKEIRKYLKKTFHHEYYDDVVMVMGFAEPREKRIEELETRCNELFFQVNEKIAKIDELEAQIEKMKNQWNCKNNNGYCVSSICPCKDKWELKEK